MNTYGQVYKSSMICMICYCQTQTIKDDDSLVFEMCASFEHLEAKAHWTSKIISILLAIFNFMFGYIMVYFAGQLMPETNTILTNYVKTAVFTVTFFNSGIVIMLMSAKSNAPILKDIFRG